MLTPIPCDLDHAKGALGTGPLGIGEEHSKPRGRQLVLDLLEAGLVRVLLLEIPKKLVTSGQPNFRQTLVDATARLGSGDAAGCDDSLSLLDGYLASPSGFPFSRLVKAALQRQVKVVLADKSYDAWRKERDKHKAPEMRLRNQHVDEKITKYSQRLADGGKGLLILFGVDHFASPQQNLAPFIGSAPGLDISFIDATG